MENCFIMDGGTASGSIDAHGQIKACWEVIKKQLEEEVKQPHDFKFDSWVVTHWDADHWEGVAELVGKCSFKHKENKIKKYFKDEAPVLAGASCDAWILYVFLIQNLRNTL
jgi:glyoxylase-like metal-dependent hydrolase (beta-lactamase superfamily II)